MELKESIGKGFFAKMQDFCKTVQDDYNTINKNMTKSGRLNNSRYVAAIGHLKSKVADLQKLNEATKTNVTSLLQFGNFVDSINDLIEEQEKDVDAMECYLAKFGYGVPEELRYKKVTDIETNNLDECSAERIDERRVEFDQNKTDGVPIHATPTAPSRNIEARNKLPTSSITKSKNKATVAWYATPTPNISTRQKVDKWMDEIESNFSLTLTPFDDKSSITALDANKENIPIGRKLDFVDDKPSTLSADCKINTPELTTLHRDDLLGVNSAKTANGADPDTPVLSELCQDFIKNNVKNISKVATPEEPILGCDQTCDIDFELPKTPQLSALTLSIINKQ